MRLNGTFTLWNQNTIFQIHSQITELNIQGIRKRAKQKTDFNKIIILVFEMKVNMRVSIVLIESDFKCLVSKRDVTYNSYCTGMDTITCILTPLCMLSLKKTVRPSIQ